MTTASPRGSYQGLDFNSPMTDRTAEELVAELARVHPDRILDIGCGWGELLLRLLAACPSSVGHGVDNDRVLIERAQANADGRGLASRVTFSSAIEDGEPSDLVLNVGAEHVFGTLDDALAGLEDLVRPGGRLLLGTPIWERTPTPALDETYGPLLTLDQLLERVTIAGWRPLALRVASPQDWDRFEFGFLADWEQVVMNPTSAAEADEASTAADRHRGHYLERRGVFGFAFATLGRPGPLPTTPCS